MTPQEASEADRLRDWLVSRNGPVQPQKKVIIIGPPDHSLRAKSKEIAQRGHEELGCRRPEAWCPFCDLQELASR